MNLNQLLSFGKPKELLVCTTDGFSLKGIVFSRSGHKLTVLHEVSATHTDMTEAVAAVMSELRENGWQGKEAILLSPAVLNTLIELPVHPKKPRALKQMNELVRWEVEPLLMQHTTQWSVGQLMVSQGYLTQEQADAVIELQQGKTNPAGGVELSDKYSFRRFGELAVELGYIRPSQLKACLVGQEWLKDDPEIIECGWQGQAEVADVPGMFYWQVSAVSQSLFSRWINLFKKQDIKLLGLYPLAGLSTACLDKQDQSQTLVECHDSMSILFHFEKGVINKQETTYHAKSQTLNHIIDLCHQITPSPDMIMIADCADAIPDLKAELIPHVDSQLTKVNVQANVDKNIPPHIVGATLQFYGETENRAGAMVRYGGPLPPPIERIEIRAALLAASLVSVMVISETYLFYRDYTVSQFKTEVDAQWDQINSANKAINARIAKIDAKKRELEEKQLNQTRSTAILDFYSQDIPQRTALVKGLLGAIQNSIPEDVILESIDEMGKRVSFFQDTQQRLNGDQEIEVENFNLSAWAISESAAQSFVQTMSEAVRHLGLEVRDPIVKEGLGPMGLSGFIVGLRLVMVRPVGGTQ